MKRFALFALVVLLDFWTKYWVVHNLPPFQAYASYPFGGIGVFQTPLITLSLVHATNTGIAWGLFANIPHFWPIIRIIITLGLLTYLIFFKPPKRVQIPFLLIAAGAVGNIIDSFLYGHVIDMIYFIFYRYSYPIFNIADSMIFLSVVYLLFFSSRKKGKHA